MLSYGYLQMALTENEFLSDFNDAIEMANEYINNANLNPIEVFLLSSDQYNSIEKGEMSIFDIDPSQRVSPSGVNFELENNSNYSNVIYYRNGDDDSSLRSGNIREYEISNEDTE